jgi:tetratricopeptide (TPR) repeat protein
LERYIADEYHQLGAIAQERQQFDEAEKRYREALEIKEKLGHPPLKVNTLAQFGVLRRQQGRYKEAVSLLAKAYEIATSHRMRLVTTILLYLGKLREELGKEAFISVWEEVTGQESTRLLEEDFAMLPSGFTAREG